MKRSETITELAAALAKASGSFPPIPRDCTAKVRTKSGAEYSYNYADLDDILQAVRPHLSANGLFLTHDCIVHTQVDECEDGKTVSYSVETTAILFHASGQFMESSPLKIPCDGTMSAAQLIGSGDTYGKRYTTQNILGLSTEQDDDGNRAAGNDAQTAKREPVPNCPECGKPGRKSKFAEGEYYCWAAKGGCGNEWQATETAAPLPDFSNGNGHVEATEHPEQPEEIDEEAIYQAWQERFQKCPDLAELNGMGEAFRALPPAVRKRVDWLIKEHCKGMGWVYDKTLCQFIAPVHQPA